MRRPVALIVLGSVNLILAALALTGDLKAVAGVVAQLCSPAPLTLSEQVQTPARAAVFAALMLSGVAATVVLGAAGVGLLRVRPWGRSLSIGYALYTILATPLAIVLHYFWVYVPALERAAARSPELPQIVSSRMMGQLSAVIAGGSLALAYAAIVLACMFRPSVKAALGARGAAEPPSSAAGSAAPVRPRSRHGRGALRSSA